MIQPESRATFARPSRDKPMNRVYLTTGIGLLLAVWLAPQALAETRPADDPPKVIVEGPELSGPEAGADVLAPEVTIIETTRGTIQEYRAGGRLYMVKITPKRGFPYYLVDTDGDGIMDMRHHDPTDISIPQWRLFSW